MGGKYMTFDAILFEGDNPFALDDFAPTIRLEELSLEEIKTIKVAADRSGIGMLLYLNLDEGEYE